MKEDSDDIREMLRELLERRQSIRPDQVRTAVAEALEDLGYGRPEDREELRADLAWLRTMRTTAQSSVRHAILTMIGLLATAAVTALWLGFRAAFWGGK